MRITDYLKTNAIKVFLTGKDKEEIIRELVELALAGWPKEIQEQVVQAVFKREEIASTGIGGGIAIPHAKIEKGDDLIAACGLTKDPIDFEALDQKPVRLVFLILAPSNRPALQIRFLARVARILKDKLLKDKLFKCQDPEQIFHALLQYEEMHFS